ncbi:MAG: OmpA family protein [Pseudomonadota bacterium]
MRYATGAVAIAAALFFGAAALSSPAAADGVRLSVEKPADGPLSYLGEVTGPETAARLSLALRLRMDKDAPPPEGEITTLEGAGDPAWAAKAERGLDALAHMADGWLSLDGYTLSLTGTAARLDDLRRIAEIAGQDWTLNLAYVPPPPLAQLALDFPADGGPAATGSLPEGLAPEKLPQLLPGLTGADALETDAAGDRAAWLAALDALAIAQPRIETGRAQIEGNRMRIAGQLRPGFGGQDARAAIRAVIGPAMELEIELEEAPPIAEITLAKAEGTVILSGILPEGLPPQTALVRMGSAAADGLVSGGAGDPRNWRRALDGVATVLRGFETAEGRVSDGRLQLSGALSRGQEASMIRAWLVGKLGRGWRLNFDVEETPGAEGDTRTDVLTGATERLTGGYWLPEIRFAPSAAACARASTEAQRGLKITFVSGSAQIDARARITLNRLAAIAVTCLEDRSLVLEIGGHTDDVGDARTNRELSEARAQAVRGALQRRGVAEGAMRAVGYGESMPRAGNDSETGRALNRRITFTWSEPSAATAPLPVAAPGQRQIPGQLPAGAVALDEAVGNGERETAPRRNTAKTKAPADDRTTPALSGPVPRRPAAQP